MVELGFAVNEVWFPEMRADVIRMLASLADLEYQRRAWIDQVFDRPGVYEDLSLVIHVLYDDAEVLPDPAGQVGTILFEAEVEPLLRLEAAFGPLIDRLDCSVAVDVIQADDWPAVVAAAGVALATMVRHGGLW